MLLSLIAATYDSICDAHTTFFSQQRERAHNLLSQVVVLLSHTSHIVTVDTDY